MKGFIIAACLIVCAVARPDIGLKLRQQQQGYQYNQPPATSYGVPIGSYIPSAPNHNSIGSQDIGSANNRNGGGIDYQTHSSNQFGSVSTSQQQQQGFGGFSGFQGPSLSSQSGATSTFSAGGAGFNAGGGVAQVQKHVYFYESPEDEVAPQLRVRVQPSAAQKNYKIIFIKAPAYQAPQVPQIPVQAQNEEKTLVYVLVKKQDDAQDIVIPSSQQSKPSKPEVFFIKYKTQKEAEQHIQTIQQGASSGVSANSVGSDSEFINTIQDTQESHSQSDGGVQYNQGGGGGGGGGGFDSSLSLSSGSVSTSVGGGYQDASHQGSHASNTYTSSGTNFGPAGLSGPYKK